MVYTGSKYYYIKHLQPYFKKHRYTHLVDGFSGSGTINLNFNHTTGYINELDPKIYYLHYNIKHNLQMILKHLDRYDKLFSNKSRYFIEGYLNTIINKLKIESEELSVLLLLIPRITFAGKLPFSKTTNKFLRINSLSTTHDHQ